MDYTSNDINFGRVLRGISNTSHTVTITSEMMTNALRNLSERIREVNADRYWRRQPLQVLNDEDLHFEIEGTTANEYFPFYYNVDLSDTFDELVGTKWFTGEWLCDDEKKETVTTTEIELTETELNEFLGGSVLKKGGDNP